MDSPIHAAENVDKGEMVPKLLAAAAGVLIVVVAAAIIHFSGIWNPPPTTVKTAVQHTQTQTQAH